MITRYETHLTVNLQNKTLEDFKNVCKLIDAKPIVINLQNSNQVMTSKTIQTEFDIKPYNICADDVIILEENGFEVIRVKIETDKVKDSDTYHYAEIHVPCHTRKLIEYPNIINDLPLFDLEGNQIKGHISSNEFKPNITFITWRSKLIEDFKYFDLIYSGLMELLILSNPKKNPKLEIAIFDSNEKLDSEWINGKEIK